MLLFGLHFTVIFVCSIFLIFTVQVLLNLTRPYRKVTMSFIARELALSAEEVEALLVDMILDQKLSAHIDQIKGHLVLQHQAAVDSSDELFVALNSWADSLALSNEGFGNRIM